MKWNQEDHYLGLATGRHRNKLKGEGDDLTGQPPELHKHYLKAELA